MSWADVPVAFLAVCTGFATVSLVLIWWTNRGPRAPHHPQSTGPK